jgi:hypothetical protein
VDVIVHQAPGEARDPRRRAALANLGQIKRAIVIAKEDRQPPVTTLGDVVRNVRDDDAVAPVAEPGNGAAAK